MSYTAAQQDRIDKAQARLTKAKENWVFNKNEYDYKYDLFKGCYAGTWYSADAAASWFNPTKGSCSGKGSCKLNECKSHVDVYNNIIIPALRAAYSELSAAQTNFNQVMADVAAEVQNDPTFINAQTQIQAQAAAEGQAKKQRYIFYTVAVLVVGIAIFVYFKWFRKK